MSQKIGNQYDIGFLQSRTERRQWLNAFEILREHGFQHGKLMESKYQPNVRVYKKKKRNIFRYTYC